MASRESESGIATQFLLGMKLGESLVDAVTRDPSSQGCQRSRPYRAPTPSPASRPSNLAEGDDWSGGSLLGEPILL